jgi:hypothetical protein
MRASDLLGRTVRDGSGRELTIIGIRAVQDGPTRGTMASLRVDAVLASPRRAGAFLGYQDPRQRGPWLLRTVVRLLHRGTQVLPWAQVRHQLDGDGDGD